MTPGLITDILRTGVNTIRLPVLAGHELAPADFLAAWREELTQNRGVRTPLSVNAYLHFPLCRSKCRMCEYPSANPVGKDAADRYARQLAGHINWLGDGLGPVKVSNIYVGGGTPSLPSASALEEVYRAVARYFPPRFGYTAESNPDSLDADKIEVMARYGVNRISLGVQSMQPGILKGINRAYQSPQKVEAAIRAAQARGVLVNTDLIYGFPDDTEETFLHNVEALAHLRPDNISIYYLDAYEGFEPSAELGHKAVMRRVCARVFAMGARMGYLVLPMTENGILMVGRRQAKDVLRRVVRFAVPAFGRYLLGGSRAMPEIFFYPAFEFSSSHLLAMGTRGFGHLFGRFWYCDASPLPSADGPLSPLPRPWAADFPLEEEYRQSLLEKIHLMMPYLDFMTKRRFGASIAQLLPAEMRELMAGGYLKKLPGVYLGPYDHQRMQEAGDILLKSSIYAGMPIDPARAMPDPLSGAFQSCGLTHTWPNQGPTDEPPPTPAPLLPDSAVLALLNPFAPGVTHDGWMLSDLRPGEARMFMDFRHGDGCTLTMVLKRGDDGPAFARVGPLAVSYQGRRLDGTAEAFLHRLAQRMQYNFNAPENRGEWTGLFSGFTDMLAISDDKRSGENR